MGSNKFSRALGHLKSTCIDEKIRLLDEQPTNNTSGIYTDEPERTVTTTLNPNLNPLDLTQDDPAQNGRDTSGLFMPDGTILTEEPPGDTSYILGPMAAMYYTWSYPWTMIGYIRQSDRRMVNLGRIDGRLSDWDGTEGSAGSGTGTFSSYGQLTVEQARWFRDVQKQPGATNHPNTYNYYAFYPGPPSQTPDANGRYPCVITGVSKNRTTTTQQKPTQKPLNPEWGLSGYMFIKNEKTGKWEKKYYYNDGTVSSERSGEMTPDNPFYDAYQRGGGDKAAENGYSREEIIRAGNEQIQREADQQARQEYQDTLKNMSDKPMTIDDFRSAADYSAYKNGGGDAARAQGKSVEDIIRQGIENIDAYDGGSRNPTPVNPDGTQYVPNYTSTPDAPSDRSSQNVNPNLAGRTFRSAVDQIRYGGDVMYQGNPTGRAPGLSNYWSPDPATAGTYSNPGAGKGIPGAKPNPTGTITTAPRPTNTPRVTRSPLGQPQFKFPKGSPPPANMITQVADDAAVSAARRAGARTAGKTLGRLVPGVSIGISLADAGYRAANGDYVGAVFSGVSAVPGPIGWLGLGMQVGLDAVGATGVKEQAESYDDYLKTSRETIKNNGVKIDRNAMLAELLYTIAQSDQLDDEDKKFFVAILTQADGLQPDDVKSFVQRIQQKLMGKKVSESFEYTRKRILREIKKETILPDEKKEKLKGYRPKTYGKLHAQYDTLMQKAENPASFKPMDETVWTKRDKYFNSRLSQERKNEVLDHIGTSDHYWDILCETGKKSREKGLKEKYGDYTLVRKEELAGDTLLFLVDENGKKESILQSEYSDRIARQIEEPLWEQETLNAPNDPLIKRIRGKLATQINYPDKPSPMGYPDGPTPEQVDGYHPEYGKRAAYYNALDTHSADAMPPTGDPEIDAKVNAQKTPLLKRVSAIRKKKGKPNS